jgi:hypothetical protein
VTRPTTDVKLARASLKHLGAGGALGILELAMLGDDQRAPQRDHHQDAQQAAEQPHKHYPGNLKVESQNHDGWHRNPQTERDRLPCGTGSLDDVVLQDGGIAPARL